MNKFDLFFNKTKYKMGVEGLEPSRLIKSTDFKSVVSTIPPYPQA